MSRLYLFIAILFFYNHSNAQSEKVLDSLSIAYTNAKHDTTQILVLLEIASQYDFQSDTCLSLSTTAFNRSKQIGFTKGVGRSLTMIGTAYLRKDNYALALEHFHKSREVMEGIKDLVGLAAIFNRIGLVYYNQALYNKAMEYYKKSYALELKVNNQPRIGAALNNIGVALEKQKKYDSALIYQQKSLVIKEKAKDSRGIAYSLINLGVIYFHQNKYELAISYFQRSLAFYEEVKDNYIRTNALVYIAKILQKQGKYGESIKYAQAGMQVAQTINTLNEIKEANYTLYEIYKLKHDYQKSLQFFEAFEQAKDSLMNTEKAKAIANLEAKAEIERKEKEIQILKKGQELFEQEKRLQEVINYWTLAGFLSISFFITYIYVSWRKEKKAKKIISIQKEEIEAMNENLEKLINQRTAKLAERSKQLEAYAFYNAHKLRAPVATIMGLYNVLQIEEDIKEKEKLFEYLNTSILDLENAVQEIQKIVAEEKPQGSF